MDGRGRRSYKMFPTQFLTPAPLLPATLLPAPPIFIFLFFTKPWYFIISSSFYPSRAMKASHLALSSPLLLFLPSSQPGWERHPPHSADLALCRWGRTVTVQFWVRGASKMSQLIRSPTPLRDCRVLITVKELITGLSMEFCFSPSAGFKCRK